jgi:chromosome segregation ATPase
MSQNLLPVPDMPQESTAPVVDGQDAHGLHGRLQTAFSSQGDAGPQDILPKISAAEAVRAFASAALRHGEVCEDFQGRIVQLENAPDIGLVRENVRDLCEALLNITVETKKAAAEADERFASLSDIMAVLSGHMASQRQEVQANIAATRLLTQQLLQLRDEIAGQRAEAAHIKELMLSSGQSLRNDLEELKDRVSPLNGRLEAEDLRIDAIESRIAVLPELQSAGAALMDRAGNLEAGVASMTNRMGNMESTAASLTDRIDDLEPAAAALANRMDDMASGVASLTGRVEDLELDTVSLTSRVAGLESLKASVAQLAMEDARLVERCALLADDLDAAKSELAGLEDTVAALADSSIRSSQGLSVLGDVLEAAKTQIFSLSETSVYLTERLRIAEQVVEEASRREKIMATLHARAARTLQSGQ